MKKMISRFLISILFSQIVLASDPYVYKSVHQGYTCERWGKKGYKKSQFEDDGYRFVALTVSKTTRNIKLEINSIKNKCFYTAYFKRNKGETFVRLDSSTVSDAQDCSDFKVNLDEMMIQGWNYKLKSLKYLSVYFESDIVSECTDITGESYARFKYVLF